MQAINVTIGNAVVLAKLCGESGGADGWAKNQLGERRLGELFFGRQTIGLQQSFQKRRFAERRLGDKGMQFVLLLARINSTSSAVTHWMQSFNAQFSMA